jgi:hypothetical protein
MKIGHPKDFWSGMMFVAIGLAFALVAKGLKLGDSVLIQGYAMGTPARMGPAFFPFWLGAILAFFGLVIAVQGLRREGGEDAAFPRFHWIPILYVLGAVVLFGIILKHVGMLIAGIILVFIASYGNPEKVSVRATAFLAVGLVTFCALVFVWGLKLPIPLCPAVEAIQSSIGFCRG